MATDKSARPHAILGLILAVGSAGQALAQAQNGATPAPDKVQKISLGQDIQRNDPKVQPVTKVDLGVTHPITSIEFPEIAQALNSGLRVPDTAGLKFNVKFTK